MKNKLLLVIFILIVVGISSLNRPKTMIACAFLKNPLTYEADKNRSTYLNILEYSASGKLFEDDIFFQLPTSEAGNRTNRREIDAKLPPRLLKSIAWIESDMLMATSQVAYNSKGPALVAFDCGYGIMQVTSGMQKPDNGKLVSNQQVLIGTHPSYNIAAGAKLLANKWNQAPQSRPIVGIDTDSNPSILENWYYATWSYNGFSGPGTNKSNHPLDPIFGSWPRPIYTCDGKYPKNQFPYQELVWGCLHNPPTIKGNQLWDPVQVSLPNLSDPVYADKLSLTNFVYPYKNMDIQTPTPVHFAKNPNSLFSSKSLLLGNPKLLLSRDNIKIQTNIGNNNEDSKITISNLGTGLLSWNAYTSYPWIVIESPAGIAIGKDIECDLPACQRESKIQIKINPTLLPDARAIGKIVVQFPNGNIVDQVITVDAFSEFNTGIAGISKIY
ncbi:MAG: transglycosylase SLT domain-containing protein [Dehalococcoidia bacterium]|jgi:hypothetical protein|nr:MAG: Transglycosylase SLT domain-containing protein [Chloroflexota bacterium]|tara:strand:+ start:4973 stop:6298 length:1326 start_codon:yes stop_codon:yes gene_type:complete